MYESWQDSIMTALPTYFAPNFPMELNIFLSPFAIFILFIPGSCFCSCFWLRTFSAVLREMVVVDMCVLVSLGGDISFVITHDWYWL